MRMIRRVAAVGALGAASLGLMAMPAAAHDNGDQAPHSTAPVAGLINGDVNVLNDLCAAPWHWDGPIQVLTDNAPYQACQDEGGLQEDAPAVEVSGGPEVVASH